MIPKLRRWSWVCLAALLFVVGACALPLGPELVDDADAPIAGVVRVLCFGDESGSLFTGEIVVNTTVAGRLQAAPPANCTHVAVLHPRYEQPGKAGHGPAYTVYATNWDPQSAEPSAITEPKIRVSDAQPLVLFHVVVSLAWEPTVESPYPAELIDGLHEASRYLYDVTDGRMAFGPVEIYTGGEMWDSADFRILPANDFRPTAHVGGMVAAPLSTETAGLNTHPTVFRPGGVYLGRHWDGATADAGAWSASDGYRTLVHEWAHYALLLYDEYVTDKGLPAHCLCDPPAESCNASIMDDHYTRTEFWHPAEAAGPGCTETQQHFVHRASDWETLAAWPALHQAAPPLTPLPLGATVVETVPSFALIDAVFGVQSGGAPSIAGQLTDTETVEPRLDVFVKGANEGEYTAQVYTLHGVAPDGETVSQLPSRILYQGSVKGAAEALGSIRLLGVTQKDRARAFIDAYGTEQELADRFTYPLPTASDDAIVGDPTAMVLEPDEWAASMDVEYSLTGSDLTTMVVTLMSQSALETPPFVQLCDMDAAVGCDSRWVTPMTSDASGSVWTAELTNLPERTELPQYGILRVAAEGVGEIIRWYQVSGVGPAHKDAYAPLRDGTVIADLATADPTAGTGQCNRMVVMPAANYDAVSAGRFGGRTLVGVPLDIDILLPSGDPTTGQGSCENVAAKDAGRVVTLTFFYAADDARAQEAEISTFSVDKGEWQQGEVVGRWTAQRGDQEKAAVQALTTTAGGGSLYIITAPN